MLSQLPEKKSGVFISQCLHFPVSLPGITLRTAGFAYLYLIVRWLKFI